VSAVLLPGAEQQFTLTKIDVNGQPYTVPNASGFVYMYEPGSTVARTTWLDSAQTTANTNPIRLDPDGRCIIYGVGQYRQLVTDSAGNLVWDQLTELGVDSTLLNELLLAVPILVAGPNPNPILSNPDQGTRALSAVLGSFVDARNGRFGALRSGGDDLVVIQAAINYAATIGGATVYLGPGPLTTAAGSQLVWPSNANGVSIKGDGPQTTLLNINGNPAVDVFVLTAGNLAHCQVRDIGFNVNGIATLGALIHAANAYAFHAENVRMANGFYNGVFLEGGSNQYLATLRDLVMPAAGSANACIILGGDPPSDDVQGVYIDTCKLAGSAFGVYMRHCGGVSIADTECLNHGQSGFITSPSATCIVKDVTMTNCFADTCGLAAINIGESGGTVVAVSIEGGSANNSNEGIIIGPNPYVNNVAILGVQVFVNKLSGIHNYGANAVQISACMITGNGTSAPGTADAVIIEGGCILNGFDNNFIGAGTGFPAAHRHAVSINDTVDYTTVTGNKTGNSVAPAINVPSSGTHNAIANNVGT
jgi:hypothetical protein